MSEKREYIVEKGDKRAVATYKPLCDWWIINCQKRNGRMFFLITQFEEKAKKICDMYVGD